MRNKLGSGFCALCGEEVPVVDGSIAAPVYGGALLSPEAVHQMGDNVIYSPVHEHCLEVAELKGELKRVYELVDYWSREANRYQIDDINVIRGEKVLLLAAYQELEKAVRDLYYQDGAFNKVWVDAPTAVAWLKQRIEGQVAEASRLRASVEKSDDLVRKLTRMLNRACHVGLYEMQCENNSNLQDELNEYLDFIQQHDLLDW